MERAERVPLGSKPAIFSPELPLCPFSFGLFCAHFTCFWYLPQKLDIATNTNDLSKMNSTPDIGGLGMDGTELPPVTTAADIPAGTDPKP